METPLYKDHAAPDAIAALPNANRGLFFDRFFNQYESDWSLNQTAKSEFFTKMVGIGGTGEVGDANALIKASKKQSQLVKHLQGQTWQTESCWHFVTGQGNPHPVENGLTWHPTLGTPYLPASSAKGLARAWLELNNYDNHWVREVFGSDQKDPAKSGPDFKAGHVIFFDALPLLPVPLIMDVMTPHMNKWYEQGSSNPSQHPDALPGDWHEPNPVMFLAARRIALQCSVAPRTQSPQDIALCSIAMEALQYALQNLGAGAKTATGYGQFEAHLTQLEGKVKRASDNFDIEQAERQKLSDLKNMSAEQQQLFSLKTDMDIPTNHNPGSGFHGTLEKQLIEAMNWPTEERHKLADLAEKFFKQYGSKKKAKERRALIQQLRE